MDVFLDKIKFAYGRFRAAVSPRYMYYRLRAGVPTAHVLASIDPDGLKALLQYKNQTGHPQYKKYFNAPYWVQLNVIRALYLGLNKRQPISILDIGSGFGYFPYAAHFYGHDVLGMDVPGDTLFTRASAYLDVTRIEHEIAPKKKLPDMKRKFDLVTAFQICFNGHIEGQLWGREAWDFFLSDLYKNHMNEGGRVYLELNWSPVIKGWLPEAVVELFRDKYGARFDGPSRVMLFAPKV
jgi:SAM-dependent methyltransferase